LGRFVFGGVSFVARLPLFAEGPHAVGPHSSNPVFFAAQALPNAENLEPDGPQNSAHDPFSPSRNREERV